MNVLAPSPCPATPTLVAPAPALILDQAVFKAWLKTARPGSPIEYHRGHLCVDRQPKLNSSDNEARSELHRLASAALRAAERGLVHLVQRRHGPEDFSYLAIKAGRTPRATHTKARLRRAA